MTSPVHVGRALESLRNSNFNTVSAMGEVIDNSIEAKATNIRIRIKKDKTRANHYDLTDVAFYDDGEGMDTDTLSKCLQLGFSKRYNNRTGIGRFGVGMTLGAITQCIRIEVYSKPRGGNWNYTYLDLQEMKDQEDPAIPPPRSSEVPREYSDLVKDFGTLVVWRNWDREDAKINEMIKWIGRTYRKFIGEEIIKDGHVVANPHQRHIFLDDGDADREISAYDPLYVTKTKYNTEVTTLDSPIRLREEIHMFDKPPNSQEGQKVIEIRSTLLPEQWRKKRGDGLSTENRARLVPDNEGISILRNDREVFYGHIPHYKIVDKKSSHYKSFIDLDRFWGCEIAFDADLDHWFSVKNIKVGAKPLRELREKIQDQLNDTIHTYRDEIRKTWERSSDEENKRTSGSFNGTEDAQNIIKDNTADSPSTEEEIDQLLGESGEIKEETKKEIELILENSPFVFAKNYDTDGRGNFINIVSRGSKTFVNINMKHPFFRKFFDLRNELEDKGKEYKDDDFDKILASVETNLHLLLGSFALAQKEFHSDVKYTADEFGKKLMHNWTFWLEENVNSTLEDN